MSGWGRDGVRSGGSSGTSAVVVFLSLAALAVAGTDIASRMGYFKLPFLSADSEQTTELRQQVAGLQQRLADAQAKVGAMPQVDGLYREIEQQAGEISKLREERDRLVSGETESALSLRSELDQLRNVQIPTLEKELGNRDRSLKELEARLKLAEDVTRELQSSTKNSANANDAQLKTQIAERDAMLKQLDLEIARLQPLEAELKTLKNQLANTPAVSAAQEKLAGELASANDALAAANAALAEARQDLDYATGERESLDAQVISLRAELAALQAANLAKASKPTTTAVDAPAERKATPRNPQQVADAMQKAQGMAGISNVQRDRIATGLIEGQCVGKILSEVMGRAPAVTTRDLIRALDSDC